MFLRTVDKLLSTNSARCSVTSELRLKNCPVLHLPPLPFPWSPARPSVHRHKNVVRTCHAESSKFLMVPPIRRDVGSECRSQIWRAVATHDDHGRHQRITQSFTGRYSIPLHKVVPPKNPFFESSGCAIRAVCWHALRMSYFRFSLHQAASPLLRSTFTRMLTARPWLHNATKIANNFRARSAAAALLVLRDVQAQSPCWPRAPSSPADFNSTRTGRQSTISHGLVPDHRTFPVSHVISYRGAAGPPP